MDRAGFIPAFVVLVFVAALSGRTFRVLEVLLLTAVLLAAAIGLTIASVLWRLSIVEAWEALPEEGDEAADEQPPAPA